MKNTLRYYRKKQRMSQLDLSRRSKVSQTTISSIERGTVPTLIIASKLAKALGIRIDELIQPPKDSNRDR